MKILIEEKVLEKLVRKAIFLDYLEGDGVDNWGGYGFSLREEASAKGLEDYDEYLDELIEVEMELLKENSIEI